eukprot:3271862-Amphidinium_carterae.1
MTDAHAHTRMSASRMEIIGAIAACAMAGHCIHAVAGTMAYPLFALGFVRTVAAFAACTYCSVSDFLGWLAQTWTL